MTRPAESYLFVYGTLRRDSQHEMFHILAKHATFVGEAGFCGRLFLVDDYPGAVVSGNTGDRVRGELYRLVDPDVVLNHLDEYEEVDPREPDSGLFRRTLHFVTLLDGTAVQAWVYLYNRPVAGLTPIPSGDFLKAGHTSAR